MNEPVVTPAPSFVEVDGLRIAYAEWPGEKGPLICLPQLTGHKGSFARLARRLAPEYRVIAVDLRGRGDSDQPLADYGFAYHTRDLLHLADSLGISQFALIGHSFGATASAYLASVQPQRIKAVVLLDGGADPKQETLEAMYPTIGRLGRVYESIDAYLAAMRAIPFFGPWWGEALAQYFREDVRTLPDGAVTSKSSPQAIGRDFDIHFCYCMCLHFPNMHCPALFIRPTIGLVGDKGHVFTETEAAAIVRNIPDCRRVDVPGVNHYTLLLNDDPPIAAPIRKFLAEDVRQI